MSGSYSVLNRSSLLDSIGSAPDPLPGNTDVVWYSDDLGTTWTLSPARLRGVDESSLAELADGTLFLSLRITKQIQAPCRCRAYATSADGGATWSAIQFSRDLPTSECEGSLAAPRSGTGAGRLYFSNPSSATARHNMTVRASLDGGRSWPRALVVDPGPSAYSSLSPMQGLDGNREWLGLIYEHGGEGCPSQLYGNITFVKVPTEF